MLEKIRHTAANLEASHMTNFAAAWQIIRSTDLVLNHPKQLFWCESAAEHSMEFLIALSAEVVLRITGVKGGVKAKKGVQVLKIKTRVLHTGANS